ncbi:cyclic AMP response element-binding protein A-like isoform X2 [Ornithodoros turicata]|uniref:cyclic AMP response element-binding protein A-like isoform X2 n=1 Tax=Ornithodoros turicata TaxID=34597 RepID=UPI0031390F12
MEGLEVDRSLYDIGESDLKDLWASDSFETPMVDMSSESDWSHILDNPIILHDRMMSDAVQSPRIQSEHSYSLTSSDEGPDSPLSITPHIKIEDMESECFPAVPVSTATGQSDLANVVVKQEPLSPPPASRPLSPPLAAQSPPPRKAKLLASAVAQHQQSLLKQPTIVLAARPERHLLLPKVNIKVEPSSGFVLPPTPPSSHGSDSDGSLSPVHSNPSPTSFADTPSTSSGHGSTFSQQSSSTSSSGSTSHHHSSSTSSSMSRRSQSHSRVAVTSSSSSSSSRGSTGNGGSQLISNQAKGATGVLLLTEEEKRTLLAEGYPIPQRLPLTKAEERSLKKIRRKIKNKISAQESRRKKKEYMDSLEKKVETLTSENQEYKKRLELLENNNRTLMSQLQRLQVLLGEAPSKGNHSVPTQSTTVHMDLETDDEPVDVI